MLKFEILTLPYFFLVKFMLESTKKTLGIIWNKGNRNFQIWYVWPFFGIFGLRWPYLSIFPTLNIGIHLFHYLSTDFSLMCFRINKKNLGYRPSRPHLSPKTLFFSKKGDFGYPKPPCMMKIEILTLPHNFYMNFMMESS